MPDDTPLITAYLADRHVPCPACQYDLYGARDARCPECGEAVELRLIASKNAPARLRALFRVAGVAMITFGIGFLVYATANTIGYGMWYMASLHGLTNLVFWASSICLGTLVLRALRTTAFDELAVQRGTRLVTVWLVVQAVYAMFWMIVDVQWMNLLSSL